MQSCWGKGSFTSSFFVAHGYGHFIMMASGIGITSSIIGVMGQYPESLRTKILISRERSKTMLKFFVPLPEDDTHLYVVFYPSIIGHSVFLYSISSKKGNNISFIFLLQIMFCSINKN